MTNGLGCSNLFFMNLTLKNMQMCTWIRESYLLSINFADDQVLLAQDEYNLTYMMKKLNELEEMSGIKISLEKIENTII